MLLSLLWYFGPHLSAPRTPAVVVVVHMNTRSHRHLPVGQDVEVRVFVVELERWQLAPGSRYSTGWDIVPDTVDTGGGLEPNNQIIVFACDGIGRNGTVVVALLLCYYV